MEQQGSTIRILGVRCPTIALALLASIAAHAALFGTFGRFGFSDPVRETEPPAIEYATGRPIKIRIQHEPPQEPPTESAERPQQHPPIEWPEFTRPKAVDQLRALADRMRNLDWAAAFPHQLQPAPPPKPRAAPETAPELASEIPPESDPKPPIAGQPHPAKHTPPEPAIADPGLDEGVRAIDLPQPRYPRRSVRLGHEGTAIVEVHVLASGQISRVKLRRSSGHRLLDDAAIEAAKLGRYAPASTNGAPIDAVISVPYEFKINTRPARR